MSIDDLQEKVAEFEDYVQSSDIPAMQSTCLLLSAPLYRFLTACCRALSAVFPGVVSRRNYRMYLHNEMYSYSELNWGSLGCQLVGVIGRDCKRGGDAWPLWSACPWLFVHVVTATNNNHSVD